MKCIGHKVQLKKTFKVRKIEYNDAGRKIKEEEHLEVGEDEVYIPPDTKAIIFWLTNRAREDWRERQNIQEEQEEIERYKKQKSDLAAAAETGADDEQRGG